ncbi:MAG TPA: hypothetical protein VND54_01260 [Candidatus Saccharimonadales bacterium]|nr:hypothetical protein [Candidatus Saccharimonadales bacterium]
MTRHDLLVIASTERDRRATARRAAWIAAAAIVVLVLTVQPFSDSDVWWHLALGRLITTSGIPAHEPFSFLPAAHAWVGQQWLYEVTLAGLVGAGGAGLASLVMGLAAVAAVVLAALSIPRSARVTGPWLAVSMVITGVVLNSVAGVSSAVISVLGVAIVLFVISRWREGRTAAVWGLPPLFVIWANMDAGFAAGLVILLAALLLIPAGSAKHSAGRRQLGIALVVSAIAVLANPAGPGIYASVLSGVVNPGVAQSLAGFGSPNFHDWWARLFEGEVVLLIALWTVSGGPDRFSAITGFGLLIATLFAQENLGMFAVFMAPQLAAHGSRAWTMHLAPRTARGRQTGVRHLHPVATSAVLIAMTAAMAVTLVPRLSASAAALYQATTYPEAAASYAGATFPGQRIYTIDSWGGYLAYRFPSGRIVFLYDEPAVFGNGALQLYDDIDQLDPNWVHVLAIESLHHAILPSNAREAAALHVLGWTVNCYDPASGSLVMSSPPAGTPPPTSGMEIPPPGVPDC